MMLIVLYHSYHIHIIDLNKAGYQFFAAQKLSKYVVRRRLLLFHIKLN